MTNAQRELIRRTVGLSDGTAAWRGGVAILPITHPDFWIWRTLARAGHVIARPYNRRPSTQVFVFNIRRSAVLLAREPGESINLARFPE